MKIKQSWASNYCNDESDFIDKFEAISSIQENFDYRRNYSAEGKSVKVDGVAERVVIQDHGNPLNADRNDKQIHVPIVCDIVYGSLIEWDNTNWIVVSDVKDVDEAYKSAQILRCNYTLKFQLSNGSIQSCPAIFETKSSVLDENQMISTVDGTAQIKLKFNSLYVNDLVVGKRLMIDHRLPNINNPNCYSVIKSTLDSYDGTHGILILTLKSDEYSDSKDDKIKQICDYFVPSEPVTPNETLIEFEGEVAQIKQGGSAKSFTVVFPVDNLTPSWTISNIESNYLTYINTVETDNTIKINILDGDDSVINKTFRLNVIGMAGEETNSYSAYLDVKIAPLMGW